MKTIESELVIAFDVDETLVHWTGDVGRKIQWENKVDGWPRAEVLCPYSCDVKYLEINEPNKKLLFDHLCRGYHVIIWSRAGSLWARAVAEALGLADIENVTCMTKPLKHVDDSKEMREIIGHNIFVGNRSYK